MKPRTRSNKTGTRLNTFDQRMQRNMGTMLRCEGLGPRRDQDMYQEEIKTKTDEETWTQTENETVTRPKNHGLMHKRC